MHLALTDIFRARWTDRIHDEWTTNLLEKREGYRETPRRSPPKGTNDESNRPNRMRARDCDVDD